MERGERWKRCLFDGDKGCVLRQVVQNVGYSWGIADDRERGKKQRIGECRNCCRGTGDSVLLYFNF